MCCLSAPALLDKMVEMPPTEALIGGCKTPGTPSERGQSVPAMDENTFASSLRQDVCGTDVLRSSVEGFTRDTHALEAAIAAHVELSRMQ